MANEIKIGKTKEEMKAFAEARKAEEAKAKAEAKKSEK